MTTSKFKRFGLPAAMVVGGVTVGSLFAPIGLASAQEADTDADDTTTEESDTSEDTEAEESEGRSGRRGHRRGAKSEVITEALGLSTDDIRQGFEDGKSIADMAAEQGVDADELKDALIAAATERINAAVEAERIDEDQAAEKLAELDAKIDERLNTVPDLSEREGKSRRRGGASLSGLEETLGLTSEEIRAELAAGNSLADVAEAQGVSVEDLADQLVANMEERLDQAVENGRIDEERAEEIREGLDESVEEKLNGTSDGERSGRRGNRGQRGADGANSADTDGAVEDASI